MLIRINCIGPQYIIHTTTSRPTLQLLGQLSADCFTVGTVFSKSGVDYTGPLLIKHGNTRRAIVTKAYFAIFMSLCTKAVHLELVSDLTVDAFCCDSLHRGKPVMMQSDNGTNFVGAS